MISFGNCTSSSDVGEHPGWNLGLDLTNIYGHIVTYTAQPRNVERTLKLQNGLN